MRLKADIKAGRTAPAATLFDLIFHTAVHNIRKTHGNAVMGLLLAILQNVIMIASFYLMFALMGLRGMAIRGDYMLYLMSGIFMFMTHNKAMGAVLKAEGPTSSMMKHAPMNTIVAIVGSALSALYLQIFAAAVVLYFYHAIFMPLTIDQPVQTMGMVLLSWATGVAIGMVFRAANPWNPRLIGIVSGIYMRMNMITSGKMFVANAMPTAILAFFDWNPLFHTIDQGRGYIFLNYNPRYSSLDYPIIVMIVCILIGLMGEFYTKMHASLSWGAGK